MSTTDAFPTPRRVRRAAAVVAVGAVTLAACGGSDEAGSAGTTVDSASTAVTATDTTALGAVPTAAPSMTGVPSTSVASTTAPTTAESTTAAPTTAAPTTAAPTTAAPTTAAPTTAAPTTVAKEPTAGRLKAPLAWSNAAAGVVGPSKNLNQSLEPIAEIPQNIPTPATTELVDANYKLYRDRHDVVLTATTEVGLDDLVSFFRTKYAAQRMPQTERIDQEDSDGSRSVLLEFEADGERRNSAEVTISESDAVRVLHYRLWIDHDSAKAVQQRLKWARGFPGTKGLTPWYAGVWVTQYGSVVSDYGWDAEDELDTGARMKALRNGLPWNGLKVRDSDDHSDQILYTTSDLFPGSNTRVEVLSTSLSVALAIEE